MGKCPHTHFPNGTHVFVILRSGASFDDHWEPCDRPGRVKLRLRGVILLRKIRSISYWRNPGG